jgi:hypothetical protein
MTERGEKVRLPRLNSPGVSRGFSLLTGPLIIPAVFFGATGALYYLFGPETPKRLPGVKS